MALTEQAMEIPAQGAQAAPAEGGAAPQGDANKVMQEALGGIQAQAETLMQAAQMLKEMGAPGAEKIAQAGALLTEAIGEMGTAPQAVPAGNPDTAGAPGAQAVDMRG